MTKDIIGLIKYIFCYLLCLFLPYIVLIWLLDLYIDIFTYMEGEINRPIAEAILTLLLIGIFQFVSIVILTFKALKNSWSKYLTDFCDKFIAPVLLFILFVLISCWFESTPEIYNNYLTYPRIILYIPFFYFPVLLVILIRHTKKLRDKILH